MRSFLKDLLHDPVSMIFAVMVHLVLIGILIFTLEWTDVATPPKPTVETIKAVAVDEKTIQDELKKLKQAEAQRKKEEADKQRKLEQEAAEAKRKRETEEQRLAKLKEEQQTEKKRQEELDRQRKAEDLRLAEEKRQKQQELERLQVEKEALAKKRAEEEKRLAAVEAKRKQEEEARRQRELEEERKRIEEQKRLAEIERKRQEDAAREAAMRAELATEQARIDAENQRRLETLKGRYIADIQSKVTQNWLRPVTSASGQSCKVLVNQIPGGEVISVQVTQCSGNDEAFRRSVESAVYKASPLPRPADPSLFDREIIFIFKPE